MAAGRQLLEGEAEVGFSSPYIKERSSEGYRLLELHFIYEFEHF